VSGHVPMRRCCACNVRRPQAELLRVASGPDGVVTPTRGPRTGRGAYCCPAEACRKKFVSKRLFARTLKAPATIDGEEHLLREMQDLATSLERKNEDTRDGENHR